MTQDTLTAVSTAIIAIFTVALAICTGRYVRLTHRILNHQIEQAKKADRKDVELLRLHCRGLLHALEDLPEGLRDVERPRAVGWDEGDLREIRQLSRVLKTEDIDAVFRSIRNLRAMRDAIEHLNRRSSEEGMLLNWYDERWSAWHREAKAAVESVFSGCETHLKERQRSKVQCCGEQ